MILIIQKIEITIRQQFAVQNVVFLVLLVGISTPVNLNIMRHEDSSQNDFD